MTTAREPVELPAALVEARVFSLGDAAARGLTAADLRRAGLSTPRSGVRSIEPATSGILACRAALAVAPTGSAISHLTAARLHHLPLPDTAPDDAVHVMLPAGHRRLRRTGIVEHRGVESRRIVRVAGVPATGLADTWADLAGLLDLRDLVAIGDAIANREGGLDALREVVAARGSARARHVRALRRARDLVRAGSASRMESLARLVFVLGGLPEPELNGDTLDGLGQWLGRVDFVWRSQRLIVEYQSELHAVRREADEERRRLLEAAGYRVVFITARSVLDERRAAELVGQLAGYLGVELA